MQEPTKLEDVLSSVYQLGIAIQSVLRSSRQDRHFSVPPTYPQDERWEVAIRDAQDRLARFEERAERLRWTIRSLRELRDAGEPWSENAQTS